MRIKEWGRAERAAGERVVRLLALLLTASVVAASLALYGGVSQ